VAGEFARTLTCSSYELRAQQLLYRIELSKNGIGSNLDRDMKRIGYTLRVDGVVNFEFFIPSVAGIQQAAKDFGFFRENYEVVALSEASLNSESSSTGAADGGPMHG
jgi:hypothetical protein